MKKILLLLLLLPFIGFAQTPVDLVKWNLVSNGDVSNKQTYVATSSLSPTGITTSYADGLTTSNFNNDALVHYRYFQITVAPTSGNSLNLSKLAFEQIKLTDGPTHYGVKYYVSNNGSIPEDYDFYTNKSTWLVNEESISANPVKNVDLNLSLTSSQTLVIRFYARSGIWTGGWKIKANTLRITGSNPNAVLTATADNITIFKNNFANINVLSNDITPNGTTISSLSVTQQSTNGKATVNADNTIKFIPNTNYLGTTTFQYKVENSAGSNSVGTVTVVVNEQTISALVKWDKPTSAVPTVYATPTTAVAAGNITGTGVTLQLNNSNEGYKSFPWPTNFSIDESKYVEFSLAATTGYKLDLSAFNFTYKANINIKRIQVRYSIDDFATSTILLDEDAATSFTNKSLDISDLTLYPSTPAKYLKIRVYGYKLASNTWSDSPIDIWTSNLSNTGQNTVPTIAGTVLSYDQNDLNANDDIISTKINRPVSFDATANDLNHSTATISYVQPDPAKGTVTNNANILTFTPTAGYIGQTTFTYTLTKGTKVSTATVSVSVTDLLPSLIIWNGALGGKKAVVTSNNITAADMTLVGIGDNDYNSFNFTGLNTNPSTSTINLNKFIQLSVTPKTNYKITLSKFKFIYNSKANDNQWASKYQVRYSTDPNFATNVSTLIGETTAVRGIDTTVLVDFPSDLVVSAVKNQTLYIRIYPYGVANLYNGYFNIKHDTGGDVGPTIEGLVERSDDLIANPDTVTTPSNTVITIPILANDENYSGLQSITVTQPSGGSVIVNGTNNVTFTPSNNFSGTTTFIYTLFNGKAYSSATVTVNVNAEEAAIWTGKAWKDNVLPSASIKVIFEGDYSDSDFNFSSKILYAKEIEIKPTVKVLIGSGKTLSVVWNIVNNGTLTFENNASLVQINDDAVNIGNIIYHRHTAKVKRYDYTYWSSPVEGQTMKDLSPKTFYDKYYSYDSRWVVNNYGTLTMNKGEGYIIRAPQDHDINVAKVDETPVFKGVPHNGIVEKVLAKGKEYLLGNPYPSAINADVFLEKNKDVLEGTIYFWTHNSPPAIGVPGGDALYSYTTNDYSSYNRTGGVGNVPKALAEPTGGGSAPTGKIAAGQGFFALTKAAGTLVFNNAMRYTEGQSNYANLQVFKSSTTSKSTATTIEKNRVWLNFTNKQGAFKQTLVGYITGATNDYEGSFDGISFDGNAFVDFYSINQGNNLSIQGRALPFVKKDSVVLGYKTKIKGEFQISIDTMDGVLATQNIFVEDQDLKVLHDLKKEPYTFSTEVGTFNDRFVLRYVDKNVVEVIPEPEAPEVLYKDVLVSVRESQIKINSPVELIDNVIVYNAGGRKLYQKDKVVNNELVIQHLISSHQVLLVDILLTNGTKITRKIVY